MTTNTDQTPPPFLAGEGQLVTTPPDYSAQVTPPSPAPSPAELEAQRDAELERVKAHNVEANKRLKFFTKTVNQGEWIAVCRGLDMTREQIGDDSGLTMLALAYVKEKRDKGAANWDVLLECTDEDLMKRHGFITEVEVPDADGTD